MITGASDFYALYVMPDGRTIYGVAAANKRYADAGGFNKVAHDLVAMGISLGFQKAMQEARRPIKFLTQKSPAPAGLFMSEETL